MRYSILRKKRASSQVSMLIVQIAMVLAAVVMIAFMAKEVDLFRKDGMSIPEGTLEKARTGVSIKEITGFSVDDDSSDIEGFMITVKPSAGSSPVNLRDTKILVRIGNRTAILTIQNGTTKRNSSGGFYTG